MILILFGVITFSIGGGGSISPPQWHYTFGGYMYFIDEGFEPLLGVEISKVFNFPPVEEPLNYKDMMVYTYLLRFVMEYPLLLPPYFASLGVGLVQINQIQRIRFEYGYYRATYYKRCPLLRLAMGKIIGFFRFSVCFETHFGSDYVYWGIMIRRIFL